LEKGKVQQRNVGLVLDPLPRGVFRRKHSKAESQKKKIGIGSLPPAELEADREIFFKKTNRKRMQPAIRFNVGPKKLSPSICWGYRYCAFG
jgi:hypothetical protein